MAPVRRSSIATPPDIESRLRALLDLVLTLAVEPTGATGATISVRDGDTPATIATTRSDLLEIDAAQYASGDGPCLSVLADGDGPLAVDDLPSDERWPDVAAAAARLGIASSLSLEIPVSDPTRLAASLNLYARERARFAERETEEASRHAANLATALTAMDGYRATARLAANLATAMRTRATIEQAKGILMRALGITADEAFDRLRTESQLTNTKLNAIAARLVADVAAGKPFRFPTR